MHYVLTLPSCEQLPERALAAVRVIIGLTVVDSFGPTVLVSYEGELSALKRQLPGWQIRVETLLRPLATR